MFRPKNCAVSALLCPKLLLNILYKFLPTCRYTSLPKMISGVVLQPGVWLIVSARLDYNMVGSDRINSPIAPSCEWMTL
jgi:hypothetical protein